MQFMDSVYWTSFVGPDMFAGPYAHAYATCEVTCFSVEFIPDFVWVDAAYNTAIERGNPYLPHEARFAMCLLCAMKCESITSDRFYVQATSEALIYILYLSRLFWIC